MEERYQCGIFATWPRLISKLVGKYIYRSEPTVKARLRNARSNVRYTKEKQDVPVITSALQHEKVTGIEKGIFAKTVELSRKLYSDQTGRFTQSSSRGNTYILVIYAIDCNAILAEPLKKKQESKPFGTTKTFQE